MTQDEIDFLQAKHVKVKFCDGGEFIHNIDIYSYYMIRVRIMENKLSGCYFIYTDKYDKQHRINVDTDGRIDCQPDGFFDFIDKQLLKLI